MGLTTLKVTNLGMLHNSNLLSAYRAARVMVVPSLSENLSNVIMESLSCATPVVAFNIGGNADMIDHLQNGYLAKERDAIDLAKGIHFCLTNNADNNLSEAAREKVLSCFEVQIIGERYLTIYKSLKPNF